MSDDMLKWSSKVVQYTDATTQLVISVNPETIGMATTVKMSRSQNGQEIVRTGIFQNNFIFQGIGLAVKLKAYFKAIWILLSERNHFLSSVRYVTARGSSMEGLVTKKSTSKW